MHGRAWRKRAEHDSRQYVTQDQRLTQAPRDASADDGRDEDVGEVAKEVMSVHAAEKAAYCEPRQWSTGQALAKRLRLRARCENLRRHSLTTDARTTAAPRLHRLDARSSVHPYVPDPRL